MWHDIAPDAATAALAVIGALHVAWAFTPWPAPTYQALSKYVYGGSGMPPKQACITVGALLIAAAYGVLAVAGPRRGSARRGCTGSECGRWPRAAGDLAVRLAGARRLRGACLGPDVAVPGRDELLPEGAALTTAEPEHEPASAMA